MSFPQNKNNAGEAKPEKSQQRVSATEHVKNKIFLFH